MTAESNASNAASENPPPVGWNFQSSYAELPSILFQECAAAPFSQPKVVIVNHRLGETLGLQLGEQRDERLAALFAGQETPPGSRPLAQAYAGHQFGGFTMLGDGRALLLGEHRTPAGELVDIQFKGAGATPYSRRGDGRAALGPMLREYIISEAMHGLGIPTTRSLAVVSTGERVYRETALEGAVLTRVAASHIRVGTFQFLAAQEDVDSLRTLRDYTLARHFSNAPGDGDSALQLLRAVLDRQADLIARWQLVGFIHGVMNTDNMALSGETIDYGPCAFMDRYDTETVFSSIDHGGRYAYGKQPSIGQWNLARFAETLLPLIDPDQDQAIAAAVETLNEYPASFEGYWLRGMRGKLGLLGEESEDGTLIEGLLNWMHSAERDFTNTFDELSTLSESQLIDYGDDAFQSWRNSWLRRIEQAGETLSSVQQRMRQTNPAVIPRNHRVEEALTAATAEGDLAVMERLLDALSDPFQRDEESKDYRTPPPAGLCYRTFCGT